MVPNLTHEPLIGQGPPGIRIIGIYQEDITVVFRLIRVIYVPRIEDGGVIFIQQVTEKFALE